MSHSQRLVAIMGFHDGNAGQVAEWFESVTGYEIAAFFEAGDAAPHIDPLLENSKRVSQRMEYPTTTHFKNRPFIVAPNWPERLKALGIHKILPLTSNNRLRLATIERCLAEGFELVSAIHPTAIILNQASLDPGIWINAGSIIGYKAEISAGALINTGVRIEHHSVLERCCQLDPGVITAGHVTIRECAQIHLGALIINRVEIGQDAIIGAGAVVINTIPPGCTAVGIPAKVIKSTTCAG